MCELNVFALGSEAAGCEISKQYLVLELTTDWSTQYCCFFSICRSEDARTEMQFGGFRR